MLLKLGYGIMQVQHTPDRDDISTQTGHVNLEKAKLLVKMAQMANIIDNKCPPRFVAILFAFSTNSG